MQSQLINAAHAYIDGLTTCREFLETIVNVMAEHHQDGLTVETNDDVEVTWLAIQLIKP